MITELKCFASSAFGMEGLVSRELKQLGFSSVRAENGGVFFSTDQAGLFKSNLYLHFSDRVFILLESRECRTFEDLYQTVFSIDWCQFFSGNESIDVSCKCVKSVLMSTRDCQSISKKAIIDKCRQSSGISVFPENGSSLPVHISIRNDLVQVLLNTSGEALSRRGYRTWNGEAPLRETLAAALVELSPWRPGMPLHDPCCGTGTILIEAALMAASRAPGLKRTFAMENLHCFNAEETKKARLKAETECCFNRITGISGSDIDQDALVLSARHIHQAGLPSGLIQISRIPLQELKLSETSGVFICNPPYGERLGDQKTCRMLYHDLKLLKDRHPSWSLCAISSDPAFERFYGKKADRKRRFYNGRLECVYYVYY